MELEISSGETLVQIQIDEGQILSQQDSWNFLGCHENEGRYDGGIQVQKSNPR